MPDEIQLPDDAPCLCGHKLGDHGDWARQPCCVYQCDCSRFDAKEPDYDDTEADE